MDCLICSFMLDAGLNVAFTRNTAFNSGRISRTSSSLKLRWWQANGMSLVAKLLLRPMSRRREKSCSCAPVTALFGFKTRIGSSADR